MSLTVVVVHIATPIQMGFMTVTQGAPANSEILLAPDLRSGKYRSEFPVVGALWDFVITATRMTRCTVCTAPKICSSRKWSFPR